MDFTLKTYYLLLSSLIDNLYSFQTVENFLTTPINRKLIILRHDVDELAENALKLAEIENQLGIKATYYFRIVKQSNNPYIIKQIVALGHEIGYHYEDLSFCNGDFNKAIESFKRNLDYFRQFYPVKTVCMHGSSTSEFDNRSLWGLYNLADFGIIGEPYMDIDFSDVHYLTDTGYAWDGGKYATRDMVANNSDLSFHSTYQIIECIEKGELPDKCMILAHTLWTDNFILWIFLHFREWLRNNIKLISQKNKYVAKIYKLLVNVYWKK